MISPRLVSICDALRSLVPSAGFTATYNDDNSINKITWESEIAQPSDSEIQAEITRLQSAYDSKQYQRDRQPEYPPITDYLDGIVKGDQGQIDKYIADCLAVKDKYPK
jgi:hypothetical protein